MRRWTRLCLSIGGLLSLTACWLGDPWFAASEAVAVLPDGSYRLAERSAPPGTGDRIRVRRQADHSLLIDDAKTPWRAIIVPLEARKSTRFLVQLQKQDTRRPGHTLFVLLDTAGGRYRVAVLGCEGAAQAAAKRSGGFVTRDPQSAPTCVFHDRKTLLTQMRVAADQEPVLDLELLRDEQ